MFSEYIPTEEKEDAFVVKFMKPYFSSKHKII